METSETPEIPNREDPVSPPVTSGQDDLLLAWPTAYEAPRIEPLGTLWERTGGSGSLGLDAVLGITP